jgi:hypothetical protein
MGVVCMVLPSRAPAALAEIFISFEVRSHRPFLGNHPTYILWPFAGVA